jgi:hypothetical protein
MYFMKTKFSLWAAALTAGLAISSCAVDEFDGAREPSPVPNGPKAYVTAGTPAKLTFIPSDAQQFVVRLGRNTADGTATFDLYVADTTKKPATVFTVPPQVTFAAGAKEADVTVTFNLEIGETAFLTIGLKDDDAYAYGIANTRIEVLRDYVWKAAGVAEYTSQWQGATADIPIEYAEGTSPKLYRLVSPHHALYSPAQDGYNILFYLDDDYNAKEFPERQPIGEVHATYGMISMFVTSRGDVFSNIGNVFTVVASFIVSAGTFGQNKEVFVWKEGYPGVIPAPINISYLNTLADAASVAEWTLEGSDTASYFFEDDNYYGMAFRYYSGDVSKATTPKITTFNIDTLADTLTFAYITGYQTYVDTFYKEYIDKIQRDTALCSATPGCTTTLAQIRTAAQRYADTVATDVAKRVVTTTLKVSVWDAWSGATATEVLNTTISGADVLEDGLITIPLDAYKDKDIKVIVEITGGEIIIWNYAVAASTARQRMFE